MTRGGGNKQDIPVADKGRLRNDMGVLAEKGGREELGERAVGYKVH